MRPRPSSPDEHTSPAPPVASLGARTRGRGPIGYVRAVFTAPFLTTPERVFTLSPREFERQRRSGLLRLILFSMALVLVFPVIPAAMLGQRSALFVLTLVSELLLACVCLIINSRGYETLAAAVFVFCTLFLGLDFAIRNPDGLTLGVYLIYAFLALVTLIAGLVLPIWVMWLAAGMLVGSTILGVLFTPTTSSVLAPAGNRFSAVALLVADQALAAVFSWMYARNASAGVRGAIQAIERERELTALKDQFLIDANHELRTPIMAWYNNMELLQQLGGRASAAQRERILTRAMGSGDAVLRLLQTVLDAGSLEAGAPRLFPRPVELGALVRGLFETFDAEHTGEPDQPDEQSEQSEQDDESVTWQSRSVKLRLPAVELVALADPDRVRQVLVNLLSNAAKYSAEGTAISLTVVALIPPASRLSRWGRWRRPRPSGTQPIMRVPRFAQVSVGDHGLGVPPREAPKLFQRFVRLERDITGSVRGTGVGLYLSRVLVEAMGGRIWVESSGVPGEGSTFCFTLPLAEASTSTTALAPGEASAHVAG